MSLRELLSRLSPGERHETAAPAAPRAGDRAAPAAAEASRPVRWPEPRIAVTDALWGEGFLQPGGAEEVLLLAKPLGLSAAHSVLLIGAGSGGPPRCLAGTFGSWVSAFETDDALVAIAAQRCAAAGLAKRAGVACWSPAAPLFPEHYFHYALALDPLVGASPDILLPAISTSLKPNGEMVLTAVAAGPAMASARLDEWLAAEARPRPPSTERELHRIMEAHGHEVRIAKDITAPHLQAAIGQWHRFIEALRPARPNPARARLIVREAETWLRRARLMQSGAIRLMRFHSIKRAGP